MLEQGSLDFKEEHLPKREFLYWNVSLLDSVTNWLLAKDQRDHLAHTLVVTPTSNSGRRLRQALSADGGMLAPHVMPPSSLFAVDGVATRQESLWAWVHVIRQLDLEHFPHLFPNHDAGSTAGFSAALALARQMVTLRDMLADGDVSFQNAQYHSPEKGRWEELGVIEGEMLQCLGRWGVRDSVLAKRAQAKSPSLPPGVDRIVVACVPDPTLLALRALQSFLAEGVPVTVLVHAPDSERDTFDAWGIPFVDAWSAKQIEIPEWKERLHVVDSSTEAAEVCIKVLAEAETSSDHAAIALCDATFAPALDKAFAHAQWPLYNPDGRSLADSGMMSLLRMMSKLTGPGLSFAALRELVRLPGSELLLPEKTNRYWAAGRMDQLHLDHLPETVEDALALASQHERPIIESVASKLEELKEGELHITLRKWLMYWLEYTDADLAEAVEVNLAESLEALERIESKGETPSAQEAFEMLSESIRSARISSDREDTVLDLQGWLELSYDPAPHLILAGMHEECVPDGSAEDMFVPDSLRQALGLRDSRGRFARDAFLLRSALASRAVNGQVDALVARFNDAGEARKPSRLLMRQSGEKLAAIVGHLFADSISDKSAGGAWQRDWKLELPVVDNPYAGDSPRRLSPSAIKDYLNCPFRFFLKRIVRMESFESGKREMNAMDFGNLCHAVLDVFGRDPELRDTTDAEALSAGLSGLLDEEVQRQYGSRINLPLMVQVESARERLRAFAVAQAEDRANGWRIVETEFHVGKDDSLWTLAGHPIGMIIDRVDRHEDGHRWRVWDYKTSGKAKKPEDQHQAGWRDSENRPMLGELIPAQGRKKERRWADVQLPLYAAFVQQHFKTGELPQVGYINLPRAVSDVGFFPWKGFDQDTLDHAMTWAETAVARIVGGEFGQAAVYPAKERGWDEFDALAPDGMVHAFVGLGDFQSTKEL